MRRYIARELLQLVVVIIGISILAFVILHVLGDPVLLLLPQNAGHEEFERYQKLLGLDQPIWLQYWKFGSHAIQGDFGKSWYADTPAFALVLERMPPTIYLTLAGLVVAVLIALPLGILAALKRHTFVDTLCTALAVGGQALPIFWLGIMLIIIFAVRLRALPASGYGTWQHFVMPAFCLGAALAPITMRLVRSGVIEVMNMEYIKTARAKGVGERTVVVKHAFRNACIPIITVLGLQFGQLLGGAIITETVFAWPGVATLTVESIRNQDFPVVQCAVVLLALIIGVAAVLISATIGVLLGLAAGYFGGGVDWTIMTAINVLLTFPFVLLALAVIAVLGASLTNMIVVLGVAGWPIYARVIRAETMAIGEREFILAGRALGMSHARIVFRQILPNLVSPIVVIATLQVAQVIVLESFLSFLGLGVQPPTPAWGNMLGEGRVYMLNSWWIAAFPGLAIFLTTLAINLMGNALRDWLDPHMKL